MKTYNMFSAILILMTCFSLGISASCPSQCQSCADGRIMCGGAGLDTIPSHLPEDTTVVDLSQNDIKTIRGLPNIPNAQSLKINMNKLTVIEGGQFRNAPQLMSLDLSMNMITKVYKNGLDGLENLMTISLNGNKLTDIGIIFKKTPAITSVRLGNNEITRLRESDFSHNKMIKMLDLSNNRIKSIQGNTFKSLEMLRYLILSNNPISTLPELSFTSSMLALVDFTNCGLTVIPRAMPSSLKDFRLGNNKITKIFYDDLQNITSLTLLTLNDNEISNVEHRSFGSLKNLQELWMSRNNLVYVPRGLPQNLQKFHIDNNNLVEFQPMLFKPDSKLKVLSLESNNLGTIHKDALKDIPDLERLNLQFNKISKLDEGTFTNLPKLKHLKLTNNPIQEIKAGAFSGLESMAELYLSYIETPEESHKNLLQENFLSAMPNLVSLDLMSSIKLTNELLQLIKTSNVPAMDKIKEVILQYNDLESLPENIKQVFPNIENLILDGNPFTCNTQLLWLQQWMLSSSVKLSMFEEPTCEKPYAVKGKLISELSPRDFVDLPPEEHVPEPARVQDSSNQASTQEQNQAQTGSDAADTARQDSGSSSVVNTQSGNQQPASQNANSQIPVYGTNVIIKPPKSMDNQNTPARSHKGHKRMTAAEKAAKKVARKAERARKRKQKEERQQARRLKKSNAQAKRNKRRIRLHRKRCTTDAEGNQVCKRNRRKCKVMPDGTTRCKKRKNKENKKPKVNIISI